jgi:hypothetical protein
MRQRKLWACTTDGLRLGGEGRLPTRKAGPDYEVSDTGVRALAARRRQGYELSRPIHVRDCTVSPCTGDRPVFRSK